MRQTLARLFAATAVGVFFLTGCVALEQNSEQPVPPAENAVPPKDSESEPLVTVESCSQTMQSSIETSINAQTASFAVGDYELAYSYASESFRSSVSLQRFIGIIEGSYGPLITSSTLSFADCLYYPDALLATISVRFTEAGTEVYALSYIMVESELGWRVDGASQLASIGSGT